MGTVVDRADQSTFEFYRCYKCNRLISMLDESRALKGEAYPGGPKVQEPDGKVCPCGSPKYQPTNLCWYDWFLPKVWKMAWLRWRGIV